MADTPIFPKTDLSNQVNHTATITGYASENSIRIVSAPCSPCGPDEVLLKIHAASINPYDWHMMSGTPLIIRLGNGLFRPKNSSLGVDGAGVVVAIGEDVTRYSIGDEVFGCGSGMFAEFVCAKEEMLEPKPAETSFEEAAAAGIAALTALQGLRDHGKVCAGQRVLINGASGGVGTYAVQLASHFGAEVTGVCSPPNLELIENLGASRAIDYTTEDFTSDVGLYDIILDLVGNRKISHIKRCLTPTGVYVVASGPKRQVLGPIWHMIKSMMSFKLGTQRSATFITKLISNDLKTVANLLASGEIRSVVESKYALDDIDKAFQCIKTGHTRGKVVICP